MAFASRVEALKHRHALKEDELHFEEMRPHPDEERVAKIKRDKLWIRDEMERLSRAMEERR